MKKICANDQKVVTACLLKRKLTRQPIIPIHCSKKKIKGKTNCDVVGAVFLRKFYGRFFSSRGRKAVSKVLDEQFHPSSIPKGGL